MKKNIPYIIAMILIIPFFVLAALALGSGGSGKEILNTNMSWTVVKEDGVLDNNEGMPVDVTIEKDGNYILSFAWDVEEPGFLTAITIKDATGKCVYCDTAFQVQISNKPISLKKGKYTINTVFLTTEEEYRKFNAENEMIANESALEDYIKAIGFYTFSPDSNAKFNFEVKLAQPYTSPIWMKALFVAIGLIIIALNAITFITNKKSNTGTQTTATNTTTASDTTTASNTVNAANTTIASDATTAANTNNNTLKSGINTITLAYAVFSIVVACTQLFISIGLSFFPALAAPNITVLTTFAMIVISVDLVGFPLIFGLTKHIPTRKIPKQKLGFFKFIPYIFMMFGIMIPLSFVGSLVNKLLTVPFGGSTTNVLAELLNGSPLLPRILVIGIMAPIFEELIFRKLLIDRISRYSTFLAIIVSGLFFGLYHGNFTQFFYATGMGMLLAFLYSKTGKIHLTIILHMIVNLYSSVITTTVMQNCFALNPNMNMSQEFITAHPEAAVATALYILNLLALALYALIGIIFIIIFAATKKFRLERIEGEPTKAEALKALFTSKYAWLFILSAAGLFIISYLPTMLGI